MNEPTRAHGAALHDVAIMRAYIAALMPVFPHESAGWLLLQSMDAGACAVGRLLDPAWEWGRVDVPPPADTLGRYVPQGGGA